MHDGRGDGFHAVPIVFLTNKERKRFIFYFFYANVMLDLMWISAFFGAENVLWLFFW
jgi:hypothetical protein